MLEELAGRIEGLDGPDREVDAEIARIQGWSNAGDAWFDGIGERIDGLPAFTASLDAAMTLVPEGASWEIRRAYPRPTVDGDRHTTAAAIWTPEYKRFADAAAIRARAEAPALALCAAALRALAKEE